MSEVAAFGTTADVSGLLAAVAPETAYILLEEIPSRWLSPEDQAQALRFERYSGRPYDVGRTRGWVFSPNYELRWEAHGDQFQVRYVGDEPVPPGLQLYAADLSHPRDLHCGLWGASRETDAGKPTFVDLRIPRLLAYPVRLGVCRVFLVVREYADPISELPLLSRFVDIEEQET